MSERNAKLQALLYHVSKHHFPKSASENQQHKAGSKPRKTKTMAALSKDLQPIRRKSGSASSLYQQQCGQ